MILNHFFFFLSLENSENLQVHVLKQQTARTAGTVGYDGQIRKSDVRTQQLESRKRGLRIVI